MVHIRKETWQLREKVWLDEGLISKILEPVFGKIEFDISDYDNKGGTNVNYEISLKSTERKINLRIYQGENEEEKARREIEVSKLIREQTDVKVPDFYLVDYSKTLINHVYALQTTIPGSNLAKTCQVMDEDEIKEVGFQTGQVLAKLHRISLPTFGETVILNPDTEKTSWEEYFCNKTRSNISWCRDKRLISKAQVISLIKHLETWRFLLTEINEPVLLYGDFYLGNINVEKDETNHWKITGIYDFEHALAGHNEYDFAKPDEIMLSEIHQIIEPSFLSGYLSIGSLSDRFEERMSQLYHFGEILNFLVEGTKLGLKKEVKRNIKELNKYL